MAIKGSATIELTNVDGTKKVIKHDNMITNAVADLCLSQRGEMAAILKMVKQNDSYAQTMFGGLLLFDEVLNTDASDYELPTTKITGYASQNAYAGLDLARGSFNESEGGVQEDGSYKFVWDFSTSQGNGTIKSLALCPNVMGKIGASDTVVSSESESFDFVKSPTEPFNSYGRMLTSDGSTAGLSNWSYRIAAIVGDIAYAVDYGNIYCDNSTKARCITYNGGVLKLYKFKLGTDNISLADKVAMARYIECIDVQLPAEFVSVLNTNPSTYVVSYYFNKRDNKLIVFPCKLKSDIAVNGTLPYIEIDLANNMEITQYTFTNTSNGIIYNDNVSVMSDYGAQYSFCVVEDYIIIISGNSGDRRMYIVERSDNTQITKATMAGSDFIISNTTYYWFEPVYVNKNTLVFKMKRMTDYSINGIYILDLKTGIIKKTNAKSLPAFANINIGNSAVQIQTGTYLKYYVTVNPFILTTKNNLDSPVEKTASQTMKITYTLSEVAENEVV